MTVTQEHGISVTGRDRPASLPQNLTVTVAQPRGLLSGLNVIVVALARGVKPASSAGGDSREPAEGQGQQDSSPVSSGVLGTGMRSVLGKDSIRGG